MKANPMTREKSTFVIIFNAHFDEIIQRLPAPDLGGQVSADLEPIQRQAINRSSLMLAGLHVAMGMPLTSASDSFQLPITQLQEIMKVFRQQQEHLLLPAGGKDRMTHLSSTWSTSEHSTTRVANAYASWLASDQCIVREFVLQLLPCFRSSNSKLVFTTQDQLHSLCELFAALHKVGFRVIFRLSQGRIFGDRKSVV